MKLAPKIFALISKPIAPFTWKISLFPPKNFESFQKRRESGYNSETNDSKTFGYTKTLDWARTGITKEEIDAFDVYYQEFRRVEVGSDREGRKTIEKKIVKQDIYTLLERKLEGKLDAVSLFLDTRGKRITDVELLYCLDVIKKEASFEQYFQQNKKSFPNLVESLKFIRIVNIANLYSIIQICEEFSIKDEEIWKNLAKVAFYNKDKINVACVDTLLLSFEKLVEYQFKDSVSLNNLLIIQKKLIKNLDNMKIENCIRFFLVLFRKDLFRNPQSIDAFDDFFVRKKDELSKGNIVNILYVYAKMQQQKNQLSQLVISELLEGNEMLFSEKNASLSISEIEFAKFLWSCSQLKNFSIPEIWDRFEKPIISAFKGETSTPLKKKTVELIIQAFNHAGRGSLEFWKLFDAEYLSANGFSLGENVAILRNLTPFKVFDIRIFENFVKQFAYSLSYDNMRTLDQHEIQTLIQVVGLNLLAASFQSEGQGTINRLQDLEGFSIKFFRAIEKILLSVDKRIKEFQIEGLIQYFLIFITLVHRHSWFNEFGRTLSLFEQKLYHSSKDFDFVQLLKIIVIEDSYCSKETSENISLFRRAEKLFSDFLANSLPGELVMVAQTLWKYGYKEKYIWSSILAKAIEVLDSLDLREMTILGTAFQELTVSWKEASSEVENENDENGVLETFWAYFLENLKEREDQFSVQKLKILRQVFKENEQVAEALEVLEKSHLERQIENEKKGDVIEDEEEDGEEWEFVKPGYRDGRKIDSYFDILNMTL